ncbi:MAG: hypothetical protein ACTHN5_17745 [Phycisphaerae bacterium]
MPKQHGATAIPATFLIARDGRGDALRKAVAEALAHPAAPPK